MAPASRFTADQQRQMVLDAAVRCIKQSSLLDFTMSAIAKEAGLSMGSVYKQVQSKEDVLVALSVRTSRHELDIFKRFMALSLSTPQRFLAITLSDPKKTLLYCFCSQLDMLASNHAVLKRASAFWHQRLAETSEQVQQLFRDVAQQAVDNGELILDPGSRLTPEQQLDSLLIGSWALCRGYCNNVEQHLALTDGSNAAPYPLAIDAAIVTANTLHMNSFNWRQPLDEAALKQVVTALEQEGLR